MSAEFAPTQSSETSDSDYTKAMQKQQLEAAILAGGELYDQTHVDHLMNQADFEMTPKEDPQVAYLKAVQKQQMEAGVLAGGEAFDQTRVETVMSQTPTEAFVPVTTETEISSEGAEFLKQLTIPDTEEDNAELLASEAARRQLEFKTILKQRDFEERALKNNWTNEKVEEEQARLLQK